MFNAMKPEDLLRAIGVVLRTTAAADGPLDEYQRGQLLSASSIARFLAAEQAGAPPALARAARDIVAQLDASPVAAVDGLSAAFASAPDGPALGGLLCDLFERLHADGSEAASRLLEATRHIVRGLVDSEVAALAAGPPR